MGLHQLCHLTGMWGEKMFRHEATFQEDTRVFNHFDVWCVRAESAGHGEAQNVSVLGLLVG